MEPHDLEPCIFRIVAERRTDDHKPGTLRQENTLGTGFFIQHKDRKTLALTCWHVINPPSPHWPSGKVLIEYQGTIYEATILQDKSNPHQDLAVLAGDIEHVKTVTLDPEWHRGDRVYVVGFQEQNEFAEPVGIDSNISEYNWYAHPIFGSNQQEVINFISDGIQFRPGMSGAPILNLESGKVCAVQTGYRPQAPGVQYRGYGIELKHLYDSWPEFRVICSPKSFNPSQKRTAVSQPTVMTIRQIIEDQQTPRDYLIALVHEFAIEPAGQGVCLRLQVRDTDQAVFDHAGKEWLRRQYLENPEKIRCVEAQLKKKRLRYRDPCFPLRWASGGALPVIEHRDQEYLVLFFRDIFPKGWDIANGASEAFEDEMVLIGNLVEREFKEELIIYHPKESTVYYLEIPNSHLSPLKVQNKALKEWGLDRCSRKPLRCVFESGPDSVHVTAFERGSLLTSALTTDLYVSFNPYELGIECIKVARIELPQTLDLEDLIFLDGEYLEHDAKKLLDRPVGLLSIRKYVDWVKSNRQSDLPFDYIYQGGKRLGDISHSACIAAQWQYRNEFCDVTEKTITRYLESKTKRAKRTQY